MSDRLNALAAAFVAARHDPARPVAAALLRDLTAEDAMAIQGEVLRRLGETVPVAKVSVVEGRGRAAPIMASEVIASGGTLDLAGGSLLGLELEIAAVLKTDITPEIAARGPDAVRDAIDHYIVGIELIATRIDDRNAAGPFGAMADNMITAGYVLGSERLATLPDIEGLPMTGTINGEPCDFGRAAHPFGDAISPIRIYAAAPYDHFGGFRAGLVITTGSLSPLIEVPPGANVSLKLGEFAPVTLTLA